MKIRRTFSLITFIVISSISSEARFPLVFADQIEYFQVVLTVEQSKRLIAKGVKNNPIVKEAYENGTICICRGTTTTCVAEEFLGKKLEPFSYTIGVTLPENSTARKNASKVKLNDIIIRNGSIHMEGEKVTDVVKTMNPGDVLIKGANALNYERKVAGGLIGNPTGGTVGGIWGHIYGKKLQLVIPVGLEKEIGFDILKVSKETITARTNLTLIPMTGIIVTEIEAMEILTGARVFQISAGGVHGAEGSVRLLVKGTGKQIKKAKKIISEIVSEKPIDKK